MRRARIKAPEHHRKAYYHCVSRVVDRQFVLQETEKEEFVRVMRIYEKLYGLRVLTYCIMSNHFHVLVEVPQRPEGGLSNEELVSLVRECLGEREGNALERMISKYAEGGREEELACLRENWFSRMWNVSSFMQVVKQRFTQWYNRRKNRAGTLWEGRFHSSLVQAEGRALKTMAAYIDLNPVRAGICKDPMDYRWSGYGEAVAGRKQARRSLYFLTTVCNGGGLKPEEYYPQNERESLAMWRRYMFGLPENPAHIEKRRREQKQAERNFQEADPHGMAGRRLPREKALEVLAEGGKLTGAQVLGCRVRYFCDGAAIGARDFVEEVFLANREKFGKTRKEGARKARGLQSTDGSSFFTLRDLRKNVFT